MYLYYNIYKTSIDTEKQFAAGNFYDCKAGDSCRVAFDTK